MDPQTERDAYRRVSDLRPKVHQVSNLCALRAWPECGRQLRVLAKEAEELADAIDPQPAGDAEEPFT